MEKTQTNRARGELLSVVLVAWCVYMRATVKINTYTLNKYTAYVKHLHINV